MNLARVTVPKAFFLVKPLPFRPEGQPLPLQVTVTVAPNGTFLTWRVVNLVVVFLADGEERDGHEDLLRGARRALDDGSATAAGGGGVSAPSQFSSTPLPGTSLAPGCDRRVAVVAVDVGVEAVGVGVGDGDRPGAAGGGRVDVAGAVGRRGPGRSGGPAARPSRVTGARAGGERGVVEAALERRAGRLGGAELEGLGGHGLEGALAGADGRVERGVRGDGVDDPVVGRGRLARVAGRAERGDLEGVAAVGEAGERRRAVVARRRDRSWRRRRACTATVVPTRLE